MYSNYLFHDLHSKIKIKHNFFKCFVAVFYALFSLPSLAANQFSFTEYNVAFVLGLSLPVLLITALLSKKITIAWQFPATLTLSIFAFLYALTQFTIHQHAYVLTAASLLLTFTYLWPYFNQTEPPVKNKTSHVIIMLTAATGFTLSIWLLPTAYTYYAWLIFSTVILLTALVRLMQIRPLQTQNISRMFIQWGLAALFVINTYLWLNASVSTTLLTLSCVLNYLVTIINGNWLLVQKISHDLSSLNEPKTNQVTNNELFSYTHDLATHLPTHQHALQHFNQLIKNNSQPNYAVIVFQPIDFSEVNSFLGHQNSDILLLQLAYVLQQKTAKNNSLINFENSGEVIKLARLPGLRFLIIADLSLSHHPDRAVIDDICKQLAASVPKAMSFKSFSLNFELAFGVSLIKSHDQTVNKAIAHAEDALLKNQQNKTCINYFDSAQLLHTEQQLLKMEALKAAIVNNTITWFVQPQIGLDDFTVQGFYFSANWQPPIKENEDIANKLTLEQFIPIAELSGDIYLLARKMITEAFKLLAQLQQQDVKQTVSINLSSKYLLEPDLIDFIDQRAHQYQVSCKYLIVELSEQLIVNEKKLSKEFIDQLRALDVKVAINEFSGSYEALRFLRKIIINQIKINCEPLVTQEDISTDKAITNALINSASTINIPLIATHIDTDFAKQTYLSIGGKIAEGKALGRTLNIDDVDPWLKAWEQQHTS